jgi:hypothetical protein
LTIVLGPDGLFLRAVARMQRLHAIMSRAGVAVRRFELLPWFVTAIVLLVWYPFTRSSYSFGANRRWDDQGAPGAGGGATSSPRECFDGRHALLVTP